MGTDNLCIGCMKPKSECSCGYTEGNQKHRTALPERTVLKGKYLIGKVLGEPGGFGVTYIGYNMHLEKRVAIKEYYPQSLVSRGNDSLTVHSNKTGKDQDKSYGLKKFLDEAKILAKFNHPNIVKVYDYFEANNTGYIVMEYYEGETLEEYIKKRGKMKEKLVKELMVPVLDGLREVHKGNYLHRDIKPENIYLTKEGIPKLIDFGAAREDFEEKTKSVMLTPGYAPYEQYSENLPQGVYTDVYGVAATMYKMLTGKKPPAAPDRMADDKIEDLKEVVEVSEELDRAVMKGLAVKREARYQDIHMFQEEIMKGVYDRNINCPECGEKIDKNSKFCKYCGENFVEKKKKKGREKRKKSKRNEKKRNKKNFIGLGVVAVVLLLISLIMNSNIDNKPELARIGDQTVEVGEELRIKLEGRDLDGDSIEFVGNNMPYGAKIEGEKFVWKPEEGAGGRSYNVTIRAEANSKSDSREFSIEVKEKKKKVREDMVLVEAGETTSANGSLSLGYDIEMGKYEVTHKEYIEFLNSAGVVSDGSYEGKEVIDMDDSDCAIENNGSFYFGGSDYAGSEDTPVIEITWYGAVAYCNWLSEQENLTPAYDLSSWELINSDESTLEGYRLPTEDEWEYAARGGKDGDATTYSGSDTIGDVAWYKSNSDSKTNPVGEKEANELGIYDMSGNVDEWTNTPSASYRIGRGGSWGGGAGDCEVDYRISGTPSDSGHFLGFRLIKTN